MDILNVYVGLDYHSDSIRVCVMTEDGMVLINRSAPNSVGAVMEAVQKVAPVVLVRGVAIEACTGSAEFASRLRECSEWPVKLAHAAAVHALKKGPDKTDKGDAWQLADLIRVNYLPEVWIPDQQTRQLRHLVRYRQALMADAKDVKLRIRSLLKEEGVLEECHATSWTKKWLHWLSTATLPAESRWILDHQLSLLTDLQAKIDEVDEHMEQITLDDPVLQKLLAEPGVGLVTAMLLRAVVGCFRRFRKSKQLARYCATTPRNASSGKRQADAGLVRAGHDELRAALIQLAKRLPRMDPHWREFKDRMKNSKPANVISAAIANRWLRRLHHTMASDQVAATESAAA